jgi:hypothetical protein
MRAYFDLVRDTLTELRDDGRLRDVDPTVATFGLMGTILWLPRWYRQNGRLSPNQVAEHVADIALGGLMRTRTRAPRGRARRSAASTSRAMTARRRDRRSPRS